MYNSSGKEIEVIQYDWNTLTSDWVPICKREMDYNPTSLIAVYFWDENLNDWTGKWKRETLYNTFGEYYLDAYYEWDDRSNDWYIQNGYRAVKTYNKSDQLEISINYSWDTVSLAWNPSSKDELFYNNKGDISIEVLNQWDFYGSDWALVSKRFYNYRIGYVTGLTEPVINHISVYPNPSDSYIYISGLDNPVTADLYSIQGNLMLHERIFNESLDITLLPKGSYIIVLQSDNEHIHTQKIVKK
jgi:hypothetical protein